MGIVNLVLFVLVIIGGTVAGGVGAWSSFGTVPVPAGIALGLLGGVVYAVMVCAPLALLISAYGTLKEIRQLLANQPADAPAVEGQHPSGHWPGGPPSDPGPAAGPPSGWR